MTDNKKKNIKAGLSTVLVHALIVGLLALLSLSKVQPNKEKEDGVPVLLGMVEDAGGEDLGGVPAEEASPEGVENQTDETAVEEVPVAPPPAPKPAPAPKPTPAPKPQPAAKPLITQEQEKSIAAEEAKKKAAEEAKKKAAEEARIKAEAEAKRKAAEEAAKKRAAEEAARKKAAEDAARKKAEEEARKKAEADRKAAAAANSRVAGAFGNAGNKGSSGNTAGNGAQGSPTGNSNMGATTGVGGLGTGASAQVGNRSAVYLAKPNYADPNSEGTVLVAIKVSASGAVISASVRSSTTSSVALKNASLAAAKQSRFSAGEKEEDGTITYRFKLK